MIKFSDLILFENENVLVVNKPAMLSTLADRNSEVNLLQLAQSYCSDPQVCHRLDKETSGALIIAKNPESYRNISIQFEKRQVRKIYHAIVEGQIQFDHFEVSLPIRQTSTGTVRIDFAEGKEAATEFTTLKIFRHFTLMECLLHTGRMHQIRIHLASQNASIAADELYKGSPPLLSKLKRKFKQGKKQEENPMIHRTALHAYQVEFRDLDEKIISVTAPYPKDFEVFLKLLEKYDAD